MVFGVFSIPSNKEIVCPRCWVQSHNTQTQWGLCVWRDKPDAEHIYLCWSQQVEYSTLTHTARSPGRNKAPGNKNHMWRSTLKSCECQCSCCVLKLAACWVLLKGHSWAAGKASVQGLITLAGVAWARIFLSTKEPPPSPQQLRTLKQQNFPGSEVEKTEQETQRAGSLQHSRQSGRLLKIAGNRRTARSQRQKKQQIS